MFSSIKSGLNLININSHSNDNPAPSTTIYPFRANGDAPYGVAEANLRVCDPLPRIIIFSAASCPLLGVSALYIPKEFKYGRDGKTPVILVPGTGSYGGEAFHCNFAKLLKNSSFGDPVWINVPGRMNDISHKNAEHVAYAINYISAVTGKKVAVCAWSQGNLATQWTLKYWPSTRLVVDNFIALSADFHGTIQASILMPIKIGLGNPGVWSQRMTSNFIKTLRADDGDSAYVPTTSIYSATDEIVQPQSGTIASAYLKDVRKVGVFNCELQRVAPFTPAGMIYSHETVLSNPISWALAADAIQHGGPGQMARIDINNLYLRIIPEGLTLLDGAATEGLVASAGASILSYPWKVIMEPTLPAYATSRVFHKVDITITETEVPVEVV